MIPDGLTRCGTCGELKGTLLYPEPNGEDKLISTTVLCLCAGLICENCGKGRMHHPIANYYDEETGKVIHVPYFIAEQHCSECGARAWTDLRSDAN